MSKQKKHHPEQKHTKRRWPFAVVAVVVVTGILLMILPQKHSDNSGTGPLFKKDGTVTVFRADGSSAVTLDVEIAETPQRRQDGLMGRPALGELQGMYFIFEYEQPLGFWMKNTIIPLDIFFISASGTITTIHRNTTPYSEETYAAKEPGQFVLETNAGIADKHGIVEGDKVRLHR